MNELLPIIEQLADCRTHTERAEWLLSCPVIYLRQYDSTIRNRLYLAGFHIGIAYLDDMRTHMCATRDPETGVFRPETQEAIAALGSMLRVVAARLDVEVRDRSQQVEATPDHSITEL